MLTPKASPPTGSYTQAQTVTLSSATEGANIYYTTDGTTPSTTKTKYTAPIEITSTKQIKAKAYKQGFTVSGELAAEYTLTIL